MSNEYDKTNFFVYRGVMYGVGTKVKLKESVHYKTHNTNVTRNDMYVFYLGCKNGNNIFNWCGPSERRDVFRSSIWIQNCDDDIEEIVEPVNVELVSWQHKAFCNMVNKEATADVFGGVLMYIVIMILAFIFKDRWAIWIVGTAIFAWWLLNQYRT
jgi:hypothetical protein